VQEKFSGKLYGFITANSIGKAVEHDLDQVYLVKIYSVNITLETEKDIH